VGVVSQHAPEDIPNVYKQRGTWALDTIRLLLVGNFRVWASASTSSSWSRALLSAVLRDDCPDLRHALSRSSSNPPTDLQPGEYLDTSPAVRAALELLLVMLAGEFGACRLRMRVMLMGLFPVFTKASVLALVYGPRGSPPTSDPQGGRVRTVLAPKTMIQSGMCAALVASIIYSFTESPSTSPSTLEPSTGRFSSHSSWPDSFASHGSASRCSQGGQTDRGAAHDSGGAGQRPRECRGVELSDRHPVGPAAPAARPNPGPLRPGERAKHRPARRQPDFLPVRHPLPDARARPAAGRSARPGLRTSPDPPHPDDPPVWMGRGSFR